MTQKSLDPHENPWKRGDVCTRGFEKVGFVLSYTSACLEIRWNRPDSIERVPADEVDDILRVAHADGLSPAGQRTNLESLESLDSYPPAIRKRMGNLRRGTGCSRSVSAGCFRVRRL